MIIGKGAEAVVSRKGKHVLKERISKSYRHPAIDVSLRRARTRREANILKKLDALDFPAPKLVSVDDVNMTVTMEFVKAPKVRDVFAIKYAEQIGAKVGVLHAHDIIHGDLTTSNMLLSDEVVFIDFGLSFVSKKVEDKAVDLHLLHQALTSAHHAHADDAWSLVLKGYKQGNPQWKEVLTRLEKVEKRGRNKN